MEVKNCVSLLVAHSWLLIRFDIMVPTNVG
jgi:hypothetical protein